MGFKPADIRELCDLVCHSAYFMFSGQFFKQMRGVLIGSPMEEMIAELVLKHKEHSLASTLKKTVCTLCAICG